jgi:hypothetical protein
MPLPTDALKLKEPLDPRDIEKFTIVVSKAGIHQVPYPTLDPAENIGGYMFAPDAAAVALGLRIKDESPYHTTLSGLFLNFALEIDPAMRGLPIWAKGVELGLSLGIESDDDAPRVKWRTVGVIVRKR